MGKQHRLRHFSATINFNVYHQTTKTNIKETINYFTLLYFIFRNNIKKNKKKQTTITQINCTNSRTLPNKDF